MNQLLLTLICPLEIEQTMVDCLLQQDLLSGFSSQHIYGHGGDLKHLNSSEQVEGRKKQSQFQMHLKEHHVQEIVDKLKQQFNTVNIHYWVTPIIDSGKLNII